MGTLAEGFRFTKAERALLTSIFERYDGKTPDRDTCDAIAWAYTQSPVRCPRRRVARQQRQIASAAAAAAATKTTTKAAAAAAATAAAAAATTTATAAAGAHGLGFRV